MHILFTILNSLEFNEMQKPPISWDTLMKLVYSTYIYKYVTEV